jgi:hypothetical protein
MITEDGVCEFLKGILEGIKPIVPAGFHSWQKATIEGLKCFCILFPVA